MNADATTRKFPPVKQPQRYAPTGREPGYDGEPPKFMRVRDIDGKGKREVDSVENVNNNRVLYLYRHKRLKQRQFLAAEQLGNDWRLAKIDPVASSVMVGAGGAHELPNDVKVAAQKRHRGATLALGRHWQIIELVVQDNVTVEKAGMILRLNQQRAMERFDMALHILADHYGLGED